MVGRLLVSLAGPGGVALGAIQALIAGENGPGRPERTGCPLLPGAGSGTVRRRREDDSFVAKGVVRSAERGYDRSASIPIASGLVDGATCFVRQGRAEMGRTGRTETAARVKQEQRGGRANGSAASRVRAREAVGVRHAWWMTQPHGAAARPLPLRPSER